MLSFIIRRVLWMIVLLLVIAFLTFVIFYILPAVDPAVARAGRQPTPELIATIKENLGLDKPWYVQFGRYLERLFFHFDFGYSYDKNLPVRSLIFDRMPATIALTFGAALVWLIVGIPTGITSAVKRGKPIDRIAMGGALVGISAPVYWTGLVALFLFSKGYGKLPIFEGQGAYPETGTILTNPGGVIPALILPWLVLASTFAATYARFSRANLLDALGEDYIRTARAKGLSERRVIFKHGLRAAITPVVTILGLDVGILFGGAILTESVFNIPGVGRLAFNAIQTADLPVVQGTVLIAAFFIMLGTVIVDIAYAFLDPRVRY